MQISIPEKRSRNNQSLQRVLLLPFIPNIDTLLQNRQFFFICHYLSRLEQLQPAI
jgi:hypothetical protein